MKRVSILGLGYIGLPTAILAAEAGYDVFGFDTNREKINSINDGDPKILEPYIKERLQSALKKKNFKVRSTLEYADCFIITVPTPLKKNKSADLRYIMKAGEYISKRLMPGNLIIVESTIPVGTTEKLAQSIEEASGLKFGLNFYIAHCPERGLPGKIFKELIENDRVIGGLCSKSTELAYYFYSKFVKGFLHITDDKSAEMVKLVENSSRDVQIAFANQIASICSVAGVDPYDVIELANKHPRVNVLSPTCGVGGHCISVDPQFLIEGFPKNSTLLKVSREINNQKPYQVIERLLTKIDELKDSGLEKPKVLGLGITFKPNVDDLRESPALKITQELMRKSDLFEFVTYDSYAKKEDLEKLEIPHATDLREAIKNTDVILVLVRHKEFLLLPEAVFCEKIILDTCGLLHGIEKIKSDNLLTGKHGSACTFENISF